MSDRETETFSPYEPQPTYDWDVAEEKPERPNILWGRAVVLAGVLLVAFFIGRASAPNGIPSERVRALNRDLQRAQDENEQLKQTLAQQQAVTPTPTPSVTVGGGGDTNTDTTFNGKVYVVQSGDTLREIADRFCGDPTKDDILVDFNGLADGSDIHPGDEIKIPEDCAG
ncbi:MAG TPA: LysM peptidoglycan-binding domain-containing protein [Actinomycetota bacterium]|nr:LysM peptidoglycan-binding domain-containing protein [Actinomycetota bacterium]